MAGHAGHDAKKPAGFPQALMRGVLSVLYSIRLYRSMQFDCLHYIWFGYSAVCASAASLYAVWLFRCMQFNCLTVCAYPGNEVWLFCECCSWVNSNVFRRSDACRVPGSACSAMRPAVFPRTWRRSGRASFLFRCRCHLHRR